MLQRVVLKIHETCREWHFWIQLCCLEHLHREITLEQHQLPVPTPLFLSSWFDAQEAAELEAVSHQHPLRAPLLLDLATRSPEAAPTLQPTASHLLRGTGRSTSPSRGNPLLWGMYCISLGSAQMSKKHCKLQHPLIDTPGVQNFLFQLTAMTRYAASISVTDNQISCLPSLY